MVMNQIYDDLVKVVSDPSAKTVFVVRDISQAQINLIDLFAKAVGAEPLPERVGRPVGRLGDLDGAGARGG